MRASSATFIEAQLTGIRLNFGFYSVKFQFSSSGFDTADEPHNSGKITRTATGINKELIQIGGKRAERGRGPGRAGRLLRQTQILQHVGGGEAGRVIAVRRRRRDRTWRGAVIRHRPALT